MPAAYREHALNRKLASVCSGSAGIEAAVIVNVDGLLVTAYPAAQDDADDAAGGEAVAAMAAVVAGLAETTLERLQQGALDRVMLEGARGTLVIYPATADAALAVLVSKQAKLGVALSAARRLAADIRAVLNP